MLKKCLLIVHASIVCEGMLAYSNIRILHI